MVTLLGQGWRAELRELVISARESVMVVAPYIKSAEAAWLCELLDGNADVITLSNIEAGAVSAATLDLQALIHLSSATPDSRLFALPSLHAKVFLADTSAAIVTSGNLTRSGLDSNLEYGVLMRDRAVVQRVRAHMIGYARLGSAVAPEHLARLLPVERELREERARLEATPNPEAKARLDDLLWQAQTSFIDMQVGNRSANTVFSEAVLHVLAGGASLTTGEIHERVRALLPELCDDTVDRVINGRRFGKRWKHSVRNAQQSLKEQGRISYTPESRLWSIVTLER